MGFGKVNKAVISDPALSVAAKTVYSLLCCYADNYSKECYPSVETMADELNLSQSTVKRRLQELSKKSIIERYSQGKNCSFRTRILK